MPGGVLGAAGGAAPTWIGTRRLAAAERIMRSETRRLAAPCRRIGLLDIRAQTPEPPLIEPRRQSRLGMAARFPGQLRHEAKLGQHEIDSRHGLD